jgi:hypothetical protein
MRELKQELYACLEEGFLRKLVERVRVDKDLDMQFRGNYINIYYKGNSLLKLDAKFKVELHPKFTSGISIPAKLSDVESTDEFISSIPFVKENIRQFGNSSLEVEYEQLLIRANNLEHRNNSEYFIIDRQYTTDKLERMDLTGFFWDRNSRKKEQTVPLCFLELKFALNSDIKQVHDQLERYYNYVKVNSHKIAQEYEKVFKQKLLLGLLNQPKDRMEALKTLKFSGEINDYQFVLVMIDYNPNSGLFEVDKLSKLPFASQIKIFNAGFAMWKQNVNALWKESFS